ncbi:hypothetical protein [Tessaracoccus aquimaris]|nr:hypothetical protein [Tessaracoccus aquimaris]
MRRPDRPRWGIPLLASNLAMAAGVAALSWVAVPASACDISPIVDPPPMQERIDEAALVAVVTVVDEYEPIGAHHASYDVDFTTIWKGDPLPGTRIEAKDTSCGNPRFNVGDKILVFNSTISQSYGAWMGDGMSVVPDIEAAVGPGKTAASDPELFEKLNTHVPAPVPVDPLKTLPVAARWALSGLLLLNGTAAIIAIAVARRRRPSPATTP